MGIVGLVNLKFTSERLRQVVFMNQIEKDIKNFLVSVIKEISDQEFQERIWLRGEGPEISSADELFCNFFDDINIEEVMKNYKKYEISNSQLNLLQKLYKLMREYSDNSPITLDPIVVLSDPKWQKIREFANEVYKELKK